MEDMAWFLLKFAKDHSLAMTNRSWGAAGTRTVFGRSKAEHRSGQHFESEAAARSAHSRAGKMFSAMVSGRAGRLPQVSSKERGMEFPHYSKGYCRRSGEVARKRASEKVVGCATRTDQPYRTRRNRQLQRGYLKHRNRRMAQIFMGELRQPCLPSARPIYAGPAAAGYGMTQRHRCSGRSLSRAPRHAGRR